MIKVPVLSEIEDQKIRKVFQDLFFNLNSELFIKSELKFYVMEFSKAETKLKVPHSLNYAPLDAIITSQIGTGVLSFDYDLFDGENIYVTTTGPVKVRFLLGRYI
jgi:hypothetical protein